MTRRSDNRCPIFHLHLTEWKARPLVRAARLCDLGTGGLAYGRAYEGRGRSVTLITFPARVWQHQRLAPEKTSPEFDSRLCITR